MQDGLDAISRFAADWLIVFGMDKSNLVVFHRDAKSAPRPPFARLTLARAALTRVESYPYLGLILQSDMRWTLQAKAVAQKAHKLGFALCRLINERGPPNSLVLRNIIFATLFSVVGYALHLWRPSQEQLAVIERRMLLPLRRALGVPHRANTLCLLAELRLPCLPDFRRYRLLTYGRRLLRMHGSVQPHPATLALLTSAPDERERVLLPGAQARYCRPLMVELEQTASDCHLLLHQPGVARPGYAHPSRLLASFATWTDLSDRAALSTLQRARDGTRPRIAIELADFKDATPPAYLHLDSKTVCSARARLRLCCSALPADLPEARHRHDDRNNVCSFCEASPADFRHFSLLCQHEPLRAARERCRAALRSLPGMPPDFTTLDVPFFLGILPANLPEATLAAALSISSTFISALQHARAV
jgi:hypothetical protein